VANIVQFETSVKNRAGPEPADFFVPTLRDLKVAPTDSSVLVGAGFSLRYTARDLKVAPTDPSDPVAAVFTLRFFPVPAIRTHA
jgi:hypothetical protein